MRTKQKPVQISDIAKEVGLSASTVSRVLSGNGYASEKSKQLVLQAKQKFHYTPHGPARRLARKVKSVIGFMMTDIANPFYSYIAEGVLDFARSCNYQVLISATNEDPELERACLDLFMEERVAGIVAVPTGHNYEKWREVINLGIEVVLVGRELHIADIDGVLVDNIKGGFDATSYLLHLGHRRIGILCGPSSATSFRDRLEGYTRAYHELNIPIDADLIKITSLKEEDGIEAVKELLSLRDPPTAIFALNNVLGEAVLFVLREKGLTIPQDISLVMFDDPPWASLVFPGITVISQSPYDLGYIGVELLHKRLNQGNQATRRQTKVVLPHELVIRESCIPFVRIS
jgi:LacI family transcriptional regulator